MVCPLAESMRFCTSVLRGEAWLLAMLLERLVLLAAAGFLIGVFWKANQVNRMLLILVFCTINAKNNQDEID